MRHSCWGFIESACTEDVLTGRRRDTVRRVGRPGSRVATAEERPPIAPRRSHLGDRTSESRLCFTLSTETVD